MRRAWLIVASLLVIPTSQDADAAPTLKTIKPGSTCTKLNKTQVLNSLRFTCVKSDKKLIWSAGVRVRTPVSKPSPTPAPSNKPTPSATANPGENPSSVPISNEPKAGSECENIGSRIPKTSNSFLECRMIADGKLQFFLINRNANPPTNLSSLGNIKDCQVPDQTNRPAGATPIGYKTNRYQNPSYPTEGHFKIAIIPVDFSDVPGGPLNRELIAKSAKAIEKWFEYESNGKLTVSVIEGSKWYRAPKTSENYNWNHPGTKNPTKLSDNEIGQDFINISDTDFDFTNVGALFIMHPDRIKTIEYGMMAATRVHTNEGDISPFLVSNGYEDDRQDGALWAYWVHEIMHHVGLTGHAPDDLWYLDLMDLQSGFGLSTTTWNQLIIDWLPSEQLYCRTVSNLTKDEVTLTSIDSLSKGVKSAMIAVSSHEVLVIESRRKDYWTSSDTTLVPKEAFDGFYGVSIYVVDTKKENDDFEGDRNAPDYESSKHKFAANLKIATNRPNEFKGMPNLNYLMLLGESVIFRNIKISLIDSGDFDTVKIEKI